MIKKISIYLLLILTLATTIYALTPIQADLWLQQIQTELRGVRHNITFRNYTEAQKELNDAKLEINELRKQLKGDKNANIKF